MINEFRPNKSEIEFLNLAYNKFYDIFDEVFRDDFWEKDPYYRFSKINTAFAIYAELLNYEPIKLIQLKKTVRQWKVRLVVTYLSLLETYSHTFLFLILGMKFGLTNLSLIGTKKVCPLIDF